MTNAESARIIECPICNYQHHVQRHHCPVCGAKRVFLGSHSFERQHTRIQYRNDAEVELVRGYRTNLAFSFITAQ